MNILLVASEAIPFAKTGGLADVIGSLPIELSKLGHHVTVMLPAYRQVYHSGQPIQATDILLDIPIGNKIVTGRLLRSDLPGSDVPVYLVEQSDYYDREQLYREEGVDYKDNCERFVFFCRAVMESIRLLRLDPDVLHANDWQAGLIPAYLDIEYRNARGYSDIASVLTIHNMAYQGQFWHWDMLLTGLDWKYFNWHQMEFYGHLNLLKTGIVFADAITTVSPTYALEIQQSPWGCGLENVLQQRSDCLTGIINGVDYSVWNPQIDSTIAAQYGVENWRAGKAACKTALQSELGLPQVDGVPLIGLIGRLVDQKGFDLVAQIIERWVTSADCQWAILGTGEPSYHEMLSQLQGDHPDKVAVRLEFSDAMAHRIEAGADIFLMPSRFEPCGLNQLYSLKYGTVPVVHATGGLADTIVPATGENLATRKANGFTFETYSASAFEAALGRACDTLRTDASTWNQLVTTGMRQDWSWTASARKYTQLYQDTISRAKQAACA